MRKLWIFLICLFIFFSTGCNDHKEKYEEQFDNVHTIIEEHQQNILISINYPFTNIRKLDSVLEDNVQKIYQEFKEDYGSLNSLSKESELNIDYTYEVINDRFYNITITTVNQVENLPDETYVTMQGNITSQVGHEKYMFKDETGTLKIEIDDDDWHGLTVSAEDKIQIQGEVDKSWTKPTKIEVDSIQIIPSN